MNLIDTANVSDKGERNICPFKERDEPLILSPQQATIHPNWLLFEKNVTQQEVELNPKNLYGRKLLLGPTFSPKNLESLQSFVQSK